MARSATVTAKLWFLVPKSRCRAYEGRGIGARVGGAIKGEIEEASRLLKNSQMPV